MEQTIHIETGKSIRFDHVAAFRAKIKQSEVDHELGKFVAILQGSGARRNGPMISATFGVESGQEEPVLDIEFMFPVDRPIDLPEPYKFKPVFQLIDAVYTRHVGDPQGLDRVFMELMDYIHRNEMLQVSAGYKVSVDPPAGAEACFDVYIVVNPSIL
ncbi:GyrI-like domain-containing protein [Paenibacillus bouchesdurhonensis]|uniref:GyrI-like domain-containing protein n=1 Tax=Paenibacillus bouchesdurhonensis TaxID=1870990 RepID=UPI000DA617B9|nr:GyrI-like domain-containing protein [Paenibacillus bouchesdurhonensis]